MRTRLEAREKLQAFYAYYESRCPKEGMHEFGEDVKCKKCGIQSELLTVAGRQTRWDDAFAYYGEHKKAFELITKRNRGGVFVLEDVAAERKLRSAASQGSKPSLERDFNAVLGLAKTLGLGSEIIESMGGTEGFTIEEVQEGKKSDPPTSIDDPRLAAVDGNIRDLLTSYCRFYYGSAGAPRAAPHDLPPPGAVDMEKRYFTPVRAARDAARLADDASAAEWATAILGFGIDAFSWLAAELHGRCKSPETKKAVLELARDIIHREGLFTVAGDFQWSVFGDAEDTRGVSANDAFGDDARRYGEPSSGAEDVLAQKERDYANGVEGSEDRFSFDAVDIDRSTIEANLDN